MFKIFIVVLSLLLVFLQNSCRKLGLCKDDEFTFSRQENSFNSLRLDGYYLEYLPEKDSNYARVYFFYTNGITYSNLASYKVEDIINDSTGLNITEENRKIKSGWGIYKIENNSIEIQSWAFSLGCKAVLIQKGDILNDTTIKLTSWKNSSSDVLHNEITIMRFHEYSPKPDSTNNLIK